MTEAANKVGGVLYSNSADVLCDVAAKGLGFTKVPTFIVGAELQAGRLVRVLTDYEAPRIFLTLLYPPNRRFSARTRLLDDFLFERLGYRPHWDLVD